MAAWLRLPFGRSGRCVWNEWPSSCRIWRAPTMVSSAFSRDAAELLPSSEPCRNDRLFGTWNVERDGHAILSTVATGRSHCSPFGARWLDLRARRLGEQAPCIGTMPPFSPSWESSTGESFRKGAALLTGRASKRLHIRLGRYSLQAGFVCAAAI